MPDLLPFVIYGEKRLKKDREARRSQKEEDEKLKRL